MKHIPTAQEVIELICPDTTIKVGSWPEYEISSKTIYIPRLAGRHLRELISAAHEAFHALRHRNNDPFYTDMEKYTGEYYSRPSMDEEAVEEHIVINLTERWCLQNLPFKKESINKHIAYDKRECIKPSKGFVSQYGK